MEAELNVLAPPALEDANAGWYSDMFPRGAWVYDRHDLLWLTARLLEREGQWNPATDPRRLVEAVYGENQTGQVPAALKDAIVRSVNKQKNVASQARQQALKLNAGYGGNISAHWGKPEFRETRLGLPTLRLRLAVWEGGDLKPLCPWPNSPPQPWALWELSQINLPAWRFEHLLSEQQNDPFLPTIESSDLTLQSACRNAASKLPDKGRHALFLPLIPAGEGRFKAQITTSKGDGHILSYTRDKGMEFLGE